MPVSLKKKLLPDKIRLNSYRILSDCYYPPDENLIRGLTHSEGLAGRLFPELVKSASRRDKLESLRVDYSRLFVGPFKLLAPPYGSLYLEDARMVMESSTIDARQRYTEEGLDISFKEVPDHIAIELEFMYFLIFKETEAIRVADSKSASDYRKKQVSFLETHLGAWIPEFADNVEANARSHFYRDLARLTKSFVEDDLKKLPKCNG